jgi:hypothetical protein
VEDRPRQARTEPRRQIPSGAIRERVDLPASSGCESKQTFADKCVRRHRQTASPATAAETTFATVATFSCANGATAIVEVLLKDKSVPD